MSILQAVLIFLTAASMGNVRLPLHTKGEKIMDQNDNPVILRCVNWFGINDKGAVLGGLHRRGLDILIRYIAALNFNCVRIPYSVAVVLGDYKLEQPVLEKALEKNPKMLKEHRDSNNIAYDLMKYSVERIAKQKLGVILNNHISKNQWGPGVEDEELWHTKAYPEDKWLEHLAIISRDFAHQDYVIGIDLRSNIRPTKVFQRMPDWKTNDPETSWGVAAAKGAVRVHNNAPNMLIIVGGVYYCQLLCRVQELPLHDAFPNKIVYTAHAYRWFNFRFLLHEMLEKHVRLMLVLICTFWSLTLIGILLSKKHSNDPKTKWFLRSLNVFYTRPKSVSRGIFFIATIFSILSIILLNVALFFSYTCMTYAQHISQTCFTVTFFMSVFAAMLWLWKGFESLWAKFVVVEAIIEIEDVVAQNTHSASEEKTFRLEPEKTQEPQELFHMTFLAGLFCFAVYVSTLLLKEYFLGYSFFKGDLDFSWGYLVKERIAPVWLSQFGIDDLNQTSEDKLWWNHTLRYINEMELGFAYWPFNGQQQFDGQRQDLGKEEKYGIVDANYVYLRSPEKMKSLAKLGSKIPLVLHLTCEIHVNRLRTREKCYPAAVPPTEMKEDDEVLALGKMKMSLPALASEDENKNWERIILNFLNNSNTSEEKLAHQHWFLKKTEMQRESKKIPN